ncbi:MAG: YkgJ family cysteine cluster protein [Nitrospira sp.]|nr:YkgJ family cysteine cluster protein [Nitrospira sp.]MCE7979530.1 hypothetical protein [Nitrospira sp. NTP1]
MHQPLPLFQQASHWFRRAQASLLDALPCSQGCCECCIGIFPITQLDVLELHRGLRQLPPDNRTAIVTRAREQIAALELAYPDLRSTPNLDEWEDSRLDAIAERFADLPCPALATGGRCSIYAFRPITCRTMGVPVESEGMVHGACRVQTAIPIIRPSPSVRTEHDRLAEDEAVALSILRQVQPEAGDERFLPYGFV